MKSDDSIRIVRTASSGGKSHRRSSNSPKVPTTLRKVHFRKYVNVEALPSQLEAKVLWASDELPREGDPCYPYQTTHTVSLDVNKMTDEEAASLVRVGDPFDIRVEGIFTKNYDRHVPIARRRNEIVMYSLEVEESQSNQERGEEGVPNIHYNHARDTAVKPDSYCCVPASKSLVTLYSGEGRPLKHVNHRYKIMEMDSVDPTIRDAIDGIGSLSTHLSGVALAMPYLSVLSPALAIASDVGRRALDSYAKPDSVISIDMNFRIAPRESDQLAACRQDKYLRYGYLFFLAKSVRARLFASTTTSENIRLMMRKVPPTAAASSTRSPSAADERSKTSDTVTSAASDSSSSSACQTYIPLEKVSYLVVRVGVPVGDESVPKKKLPKLSASVVRRLQQIVESAENADGETLKAELCDVMRQVRGGRASEEN